MIFITSAADNVITATAESLTYANQYLTRLAASFGVAEDEVRAEPSAIIKRLAEAIALRETAVSLVGSDSTAYMDGINSDDIYYRKYKLYSDRAKELETNLSYKDFVKDGVSDDGKAGIGSVHISRA